MKREGEDESAKECCRIELFNSQINSEKMAKSFNFHNNFFVTFISVTMKTPLLERTFVHTIVAGKKIFNKHLICTSQCNNSEKNDDGLKTGSHFSAHILSSVFVTR